MDLLKVQQIAPALGSTSSKAATGLKPEDQAQAKFLEAMQTQAVGEQLPTAPADRVLSTHGNLGDSILSGVNQISSGLQSSWTEVQAQKASLSENTSTADLLKFQGQILEMSVMFDVVSKGMNKAIQDVEQLTKVQ